MIIRKLILLDFYTIKPLVKVMLTFLLIPLILGIVADPGTSIMVTMTFIVFMLNVVFSVAEKSNFDKLYATLPIKRSYSILSRYLFSMIMIGMTAAISLVIYLLLSYFQHGSIQLSSGICYLILSSMIAVFFISIQYPFYFKFDYSKANMMAILPYILVFAIGSPIVSYLMKQAAFYQNVIQLINYVQTHVLLFVLLGICTSLMMISCSYLLSRNIYKREC